MFLCAKTIKVSDRTPLPSLVGHDRLPGVSMPINRTTKILAGGGQGYGTSVAVDGKAVSACPDEKIVLSAKSQAGESSVPRPRRRQG